MNKFLGLLDILNSQSIRSHLTVVSRTGTNWFNKSLKFLNNLLTKADQTILTISFTFPSLFKLLLVLWSLFIYLLWTLL